MNAILPVTLIAYALITLLVAAINIALWIDFGRDERAAKVFTAPLWPIEAVRFLAAMKRSANKYKEGEQANDAHF